MRTTILSAAIFGLFAAGCAGDLTGTGDDSGDDVQVTCGNGTVDSGEECDDSNTLSGDGCSATCTAEETNTPRVSIAVDQPSLTTDLLVSNEVNVTLTSVNGFAGDVTLTTTVTDSASGEVTGWTTTLSSTTVSLTAEGTGAAKLLLRVPGDSAQLAGSVKITATSSAGTADAAIAVTANPIVTVAYTTSGNNCVYPTEFPISNPIRIGVGRQLRIVNGSDPAGTGCGGDACRMQIHFDNGISGISHQGAPMTAGSAYVQTVNAENTQNVTFYCHNANQADTAVEAGGSTTLRQRLIAVAIQ